MQCSNVVASAITARRLRICCTSWFIPPSGKMSWPAELERGKLCSVDAWKMEAKKWLQTVALGREDTRLNKSQIHAIAKSLSSTLTLWQAQSSLPTCAWLFSNTSPSLPSPPPPLRDRSVLFEVNPQFLLGRTTASFRKKGHRYGLTREWVVQGPPGTGKTRTLLALIEILSRLSYVKTQGGATTGPVLACADTNAATDNIVQGLVERNVNVVRIGQQSAVSLPPRLSSRVLSCLSIHSSAHDRDPC